MATSTRLMTVAEFSALPKDGGPVYHELREGAMVAVPRPKVKHFRVQLRLLDLLRDLAGTRCVAAIQFAFQPVGEYEIRLADVVVVNKNRWDLADPDGYLQGSPELVAEVPSPSNTRAEIAEKRDLCLRTGTLEFWVVDCESRTITVATAAGETAYSTGQAVPVSVFPQPAQLNTNSLFE